MFSEGRMGEAGEMFAGVATASDAVHDLRLASAARAMALICNGGRAATAQPETVAELKAALTPPSKLAAYQALPLLLPSSRQRARRPRANTSKRSQRSGPHATGFPSANHERSGGSELRLPNSL